MGDLNSKPTCLSAEPHDDFISDFVLHYMGCIEISERDKFFADSNRLWARIEHAKNRTQPMSQTATSGPKESQRNKLRKQCLTELRRAEHLRNFIKGDENECHLIANINDSREKWRDSKMYKVGMNIIENQGWMPRRDRTTRDETGVDDGQSSYDPEKDVNVHIFDYHRPNGSKYLEMKANDKKKVHDVLYSKTENPLSRGDGSKKAKYAHIPANNMKASSMFFDHWAQEAIARFFGDTPPDTNEIHRIVNGEKKTKTEMVLRPHCWRGQQHGGRSAPPHARHMRPLCEVVSSNPDEIEANPQNMVLFMPYLHWETDRQRNRFAKHIEYLTERFIAKKKADDEESRIARKEQRATLRQPDWISRVKQVEKDAIKKEKDRVNHTAPFSQRWAAGEKRVNSFFTLVKNMGRIQGLVDIDKKGRPLITMRLGQYLMDAAALYECMSNYRDKKLLETYLHHDSPVHPRRTLDQGYYWTLNTTKSRDRDQVVYRSTTGSRDIYHAFNPQKKLWERHVDHEITLKNGCDVCRSNARKVSRVLMVDQLWLWVLDNQTLLTCFPKRYGTNRHDESGVHKAIRVRLHNARPNQIRSVYDIALVVLEECMNTVFDKGKTADRRPQVIDTFAEAIGNVTNKQTVAFEKLWHWTETASKMYRGKGTGEMRDFHVPLLDINPEGKLQREIKDIIEELDIMLKITKSHRIVLRDFITNVEHILDPKGQFGVQKRLYGDLSRYGSRLSEVDQSATGSRTEVTNAVQPNNSQDQYEWFRLNADELWSKVNRRIEELEDLRQSAESTSNSLKDLLALKQQQASVLQAYQAVKQADETIMQGKSILMFTVVTIIFLPLSFMASIFGMNALEFGSDNSLRLVDEFKFMFPISFSIIIITLTLAFSKWIRAVLWYVYHVFTTLGLIKAGLYAYWLNNGISGTKIEEHAKKITLKRKDKVREKRREEKIDKSRKKDGEAGGDERQKAEKAAAAESGSVSDPEDPDTVLESTSMDISRGQDSQRPGCIGRVSQFVSSFSLARRRNARGRPGDRGTPSQVEMGDLGDGVRGEAMHRR